MKEKHLFINNRFLFSGNKAIILSLEVAAQSFSVKEQFWKNLLNSQENTCEEKFRWKCKFTNVICFCETGCSP